MNSYPSKHYKDESVLPLRFRRPPRLFWYPSLFYTKGAVVFGLFSVIARQRTSFDFLFPMYQIAHTLKRNQQMPRTALCEVLGHARSLAVVVNQTFRLWMQQHVPAAAKKHSRSFARKEQQNQPVQFICHENS